MIDIKAFFPEEEKPLERLLEGPGFCGIFRTIGCVGDSLSSGEFQTKKKDGTWRYTDMFESSWGQYLARAAGCTVYNFSRGGMTAKEYMSGFARSRGFWDPTLGCQAYIIALGANDVRRHPLGSMEDVHEDYHENNPETFAGNYAAIIQKLKTIRPEAKFFLMTMPKNTDAERNARVEAHAQLIYQMAERFSNCYVIDFAQYAPITDEYAKEKFWLNGHLNALGYLFWSKMIMTYMDYIIRHNLHDFDLVGFIGKESLMED